jgi:hypothetical protein
MYSLTRRSEVRFGGKPEERSELGQHCFRRVDIHAPGVPQYGRGLSFMETDHEEAQYPWDCLWRGVVDGNASLDSMVARKERGGIS